MLDLSTITVQDFKDLFVRDFVYLPVWVAGTYNQGTRVYYEPNMLFYDARSNGVTSEPPTPSDWEEVSDDVNNYILDADITRAFTEAKISFNQSLFNDDTETQTAYLYLTAHFLALDIRRSRQGVLSTGEYPVNSRSVGSVSEGYAIPKDWLENPIYNHYTKSEYGLKYLNMVLPRLVGNVFTVNGATRP